MTCEFCPNKICYNFGNGLVSVDKNEEVSFNFKQTIDECKDAMEMEAEDEALRIIENTPEDQEPDNPFYYEDNF